MSEPTEAEWLGGNDPMTERERMEDAMTADNRAINVGKSPDDEPCTAEIHSWDRYRPEQIDSYWIRCTLLGKHDEHEDSTTGMQWMSGPPVEGESNANH